jgi:hypothetical protein
LSNLAIAVARHTLILAFKFEQAVRRERMMPTAPTAGGTGLPSVRCGQHRIINILLDLAASLEMQSFHRKDLYRIGI